MRPASFIALVGAGAILASAATDLTAAESVRPTSRPAPTNAISVRFDCRPVQDAVEALQDEGYRQVTGWTDVDGDRWIVVAREDGRAFFGLVFQDQLCTMAAQAGRGA